jgi:hypothetical protein
VGAHAAVSPPSSSISIYRSSGGSAYLAERSSAIELRPNSELLAAGGRGLTTQREDQAAIAQPDRLTPFSGVIAQPQAMGPGVAAVSAQPGRGKIK